MRKVRSLTVEPLTLELEIRTAALKHSFYSRFYFSVDLCNSLSNKSDNWWVFLSITSRLVVCWHNFKPLIPKQFFLPLLHCERLERQPLLQTDLKSSMNPMIEAAKSSYFELTNQSSRLADEFSCFGLLILLGEKWMYGWMDSLCHIGKKMSSSWGIKL